MSFAMIRVMKQYFTVTEFLTDLEPGKRDQVEALRKIILSNSGVSEHIKWNAPSYVYDGEDRITFNMYGDEIKILVHMGAIRKEDKKAKPILQDPADIIKWSSDIRGIISFHDMNDILIKCSDFTDVLKRWLAIRA